jgi:hypothetical protein
MDRILEFHLVDPHGRVVPLPTVLTHILANAGAHLFHNAQRRIIGNHQVSRFPSDRFSVPCLNVETNILTESLISSHYAPAWCSPG